MGTSTEWNPIEPPISVMDNLPLENLQPAMEYVPVSMVIIVELWKT